MTDRTRTVGLVGAGMIAPHHLDALAALPWVRIAGVTDLDRGRAEALAATRPGTAVYDSLADLCDAGADVVHVLTPPASHVAVATEAVERGCDVLVEKPLATDADDCTRLADAARKHGRRVGVNHSLLADPWIVRLRDAVAAGRIGRVVSAEYVCTAEYPPWGDGPVPPHYRDGGYPFRDLGVHGLYLLRALLGEIEGLDVERTRLGGDPNLAFDEWHALVRCAGGIGRLRLSWNARPLETYVVAHGERGTLRADVARLFLGRRVERGLPGPIGRTVNTIEDAAAALVAVPRSAYELATGKLRPYAGLRASVAAFHRGLADGTALPATIEDGRAVVRWVEEGARPAAGAKAARIWRAAPRRRPVTVVTGAGGFLGSALVARLVREGAAVRALVRRPPAKPDPRVETVVLDLGDRDAVVAALAGAGVVYHAGAAMQGSWEEHARGTIAGTRHVIDGCIAAGARLVHVSSLSVLDYGVLDRATATEDAPLEPAPEARGHYARAKLAAETLVREAATHGLDAVIVRPGQIVGPGHWNAGLVDGLLVGRWLVVLGDAHARMPLVHVDDVVDALLRAGRQRTAAGATYHVVGDAGITRATLARAIAAGDGTRVVIPPRRALLALASGVELLGRALRRTPPLSRYRVRSTLARVRFDCTRAARDLGWRPSGAALIPRVSGGSPDSAFGGPAAAPGADTPTGSRVPDDARAAAAR